MKTVEFYKVATLPQNPRPDALYFVLSGDYADTYLTDKLGNPKLIGNQEMIIQLLNSSGYKELAEEYANYANERASDADISAVAAQAAVGTIQEAADSAEANAIIAGNAAAAVNADATIASNAADTATIKAGESEGFRDQAEQIKIDTQLIVGNLDTAIVEGTQVLEELNQYTPLPAIVVPYTEGNITTIQELKNLLQ